MRLFKQTPEDYYNAPYAEFPALIRGTVFVVMAILWAFSKLMWRWKVVDADLLFERQDGRAPGCRDGAVLWRPPHSTHF